MKNHFIQFLKSNIDDETNELIAMDINFIEMQQSLRKQMKEDKEQTMDVIQSLCKFIFGPLTP